MDPENNEIIKASGNNTQDIYDVMFQKVIFYEDVIKKTFLSLIEYKKINLIGSNEVNYSINELNTILEELRLLELHIKDKSINHEDLIADLQILNNKISNIIKMYGTTSLEHLISICYGGDYFDKNILDDNDKSKFEVLCAYLHPLSYKVISSNEKSDDKQKTTTNPILEDIYFASSKMNLYCYPNKSTDDNYVLKLSSMKVIIKDKNSKNTIVVTGLVDSMMVEYLLSNQYMYDIYYGVKDNIHKEDDLNLDLFDSFYKSLGLKDFLVNTREEIFDMFRGFVNSLKIFKNRPISKIISEFIKSDLVGKRKTLVQLLLNDNDTEFQYLAYLLFDSISTEDKSKPDTMEQTLLFDTLPWNIKVKFKCAMKQTVEYTHNLLNSDSMTKVPLEQRICLLKVSDSVKEKAMMKLKEVKAKSDDSTSKARQWLEGLLKIPFNINKKEPIFDEVESIISIYKAFTDKNPEIVKKNELVVKDNYTSIEVNKRVKKIFEHFGMETREKQIDRIMEKVLKLKKTKFLEFINYLDKFSENVSKEEIKENFGKGTISDKKEKLKTFLYETESDLIGELVGYFNLIKNDSDMQMFLYLNTVLVKNHKLNNYMVTCRKTLDKCVHGHDDAKRQIERIVGQWINGKESGYCLGFEGPPGVGKTSLAKKGLANCLKDENGESRPFAFIAIGGSSNGSTLEGHNYTYVGSQWGKIVDILIETKCMNPIIFIDEIDKVSRTESGKEIISILTHLIDPTQNDTIQDKYFSGVDIDLSKVLFVFSYNDVTQMDRILLDRIHRIKFNHLNLNEKLIICNKYILPELYEKMGQDGSMKFPDSVLIHLIEEYTCESGVRKLKELLYEIIGEVNLEILSNKDIEIPIIISEEDVKDKYLKNRTCLKDKKIHKKSAVGIMNGLWANSLGRGGLIQIESMFIPAPGFLELKLTGMQGDVMKESMQVAKSLAWNLTEITKKEEMLKEFEKVKTCGLHIHCPEGATPKDGPSAGTAITVCLYSLLNGIKIRNDIAITGEINMQGQVTAIGGLDLKILGGMKAGVKTFLFPEENNTDFLKFKEKYDKDNFLDEISFYPISSIEEALKHSLENTN